MKSAVEMKRFFNRTTGLSFIKFVTSIAACLSAGVIGSFFTAQSVKSWYLIIKKPPITPPGWVFAPVWTVLYVLMGISFFLVWKQNLESQKYKDALATFILQLSLNTMWSIAFFGLKSIGGGLVVIVLLALSIIWTMKSFFSFSKTASLLLLPYLIWIGYALALNLWIFILNR
jgi:benzodiazapine receptor